MNEWINWSGDRCPVPLDTIVEVRTRGLGDHIGSAILFYWKVKEPLSSHDIIAYRIIDDDED